MMALACAAFGLGDGETIRIIGDGYWNAQSLLQIFLHRAAMKAGDVGDDTKSCSGMLKAGYGNGDALNPLF